MGWERTKATTKELPTEPSFVGWLMAGGIAVVMGVLLFILHASGMVKALVPLSIWWLAFSPVIAWFFLFCLRGWLWGRVVGEHQFLNKEAEHGQRQWEIWAGRYLAVLGNCILLPSRVTADAIATSSDAAAVQHLSLACHFEEGDATEACLINAGLAGLQKALKSLPASLPLNVTLVTDIPSVQMECLFRQAWAEFYPDRAVPTPISVCETLSFAWIEERLKAPVLDVDLILVLQKNGNEQYSDALAAMLLTSDDVAQKYQLPHSSRLLRPMPLDMARFRGDMALFLETQTIACQTAKVFCDNRLWNERFADVMTAAQAHKTPWEPEEIDVLEKYNGIPGTASGWLLMALVSDMVTINKAPVLGLFTSGSDHFVSTITPGSENNDAG
jgi:hypothetical protein